MDDIVIDLQNFTKDYGNGKGVKVMLLQII